MIHPETKAVMYGVRLALSLRRDRSTLLNTLELLNLKYVGNFILLSQTHSQLDRYLPCARCVPQGEGQGKKERERCKAKKERGRGKARRRGRGARQEGAGLEGEGFFCLAA